MGKKVVEIPAYFAEALDKVGLKERSGRASNPAIVDMFRLAVGKEYPDDVYEDAREKIEEVKDHLDVNLNTNSINL